MGREGVFALVVLSLILISFFIIWILIDDNVECVPASCCHATSCVLEIDAPNCTDHLCSMSCDPGTMDCGQGYCDYIDGNCEVVWNE